MKLLYYQVLCSYVFPIRAKVLFLNGVNVELFPFPQLRMNNRYNSITKKAVLLLINPGPPVVEEKPGNKTVNEGNNVTFQCRATGNPFPTLSWTKDGITISQNSKNIVLSQGNKTLTITNAKRNDAGKYVCSATNNINSVKASGYLDVQCKYNRVLNFIFNPRISGKFSRFEDTNNMERKSPKES